MHINFVFSPTRSLRYMFYGRNSLSFASSVYIYHATSQYKRPVASLHIETIPYL